MIVLGIHDGHNAGAALTIDGKVKSAISEERLINIKNFCGVPRLAISKVYEIAGISPQDTDLVAIGCYIRVGAPYADQNYLAKIQVKISPYLHSHAFVDGYVRFFHHFREKSVLNSCLSELGIRAPLVYYDHHKTHAACAYYQRPWNDEAVVLTLDGSGDGLSATVSVGKGISLKRIASTTYYDSLSNNLYSEITGYLGMKRWEHEYKVMGLAPYGHDDGLMNEFKKIIRINPDAPLEFQNTYNAYLYDVTGKLSKTLIGRRFDNIAWATQQYFEELVIQWVKNTISHTGIHNIVCSGGSFLNVKANKIIRELSEVKKVFFYPSADDGGTPVGAALLGYLDCCQNAHVQPHIEPMKDVYYGQSFNNEQVITSIKKAKIEKKAQFYKTNIEKKIGSLLIKGKIVARFAGRDEWGPRSLGNRSILADPRDLSVIHRLNFAIKQRDFWMPFALSMLEEHFSDYFTHAHPARYMIEAFDTKKNYHDIIAGIHPYDRTCRPQAVNDWNPGLKSILEEFYLKTRVPALVNTSFNLHGYPMVGSPDSAISTFLNSGLDALAIENWLVEK